MSSDISGTAAGTSRSPTLELGLSLGFLAETGARTSVPAPPRSAASSETSKEDVSGAFSEVETFSRSEVSL